MTIHRLPYAATQRFAPLVLDHAAGDGFLRAFQEFPATREGLSAAAKARRFDPAARSALVAALRKQYAGIDISGLVSTNIDRLAQADTLTITTGHQLCLFLGPLYVPFKLLNAIRLAQEAESMLGRAVVPIFWMASEDHDRAEIDHAWFGERKLHWPGPAHGAVGRLELKGIGPVVDEACLLLGSGPEAGSLCELLRTCYREGRTLTEATRRFAHALFGRFGLVIIDGDDRALKQLFVPVMREEILNGIAKRSVDYADAQLKERYAPQAHARDINLFHLRPGHRSRIEAAADAFQVLDGGPRFTAEELMLDLELRPQDYSPNVLLRPVYQETVLPNIAYIGGGGEVAYWMQLKWLFHAVRVPMPAVLLRTSAALLSAKADRLRADLELDLGGLFQPDHELRTALARAAAGADALLTPEAASLQLIADAMHRKAMQADPTLRKSAGSAHVRMQRALEGLQARIDRALRRKEAIQLQRLDRILAELFPAGALQERRLSALPFIAQRGPVVLDEWMNALDPLDPRFTVLVEG
ncbi:MAG: bacillithiol biosynthesis cysteine-adding enzyme BshC [Flavobacteriales bacterium]|jgi:bacillithiol biosynthesis cysteine-adding enzyme BshC|nr:bacillithiol biosynthesis cysteine-adding enzyme BshC [Flavobacteriales bacterium]